MKRRRENYQDGTRKKQRLDGEVKIGRPAKVSSSDARSIIIKYIDHFRTNKIPDYSSSVWKDMSRDLNYKWSAHSVYTHVRENRRSDLAAARETAGITTSPIPQPIFKDDRSVPMFLPSNSASSQSESDSDAMTNDAVHIQNSQCFYLVLKKEQWAAIAPTMTDPKSSKRLKKNVWANVISKELTNLYRLPCAFMFRWSNVNWSGVGSYFVKIVGQCGGKVCQNKLVGYAREKPGNDGQLHMDIFTTDTRDTEHEIVKRPLNGQERVEIGKNLKGKSSRKYQKQQAAKEMVYGEDENVHQFKGYVLRKAKKEHIDADLGIKKTDKDDIIRAIAGMSQETAMSGVIRSVSRLPFYVMYFTREQMGVWNEFSRQMKESAEIGVDSTGKVATSLHHPDGSKGGHIFLYSITINFHGRTEAVNQMLSESHDTEFIELWLKRWMSWGAALPARAVGDYSRALQTGMCLAFTNKTIKDYVDSWFLWAKNGKDSHAKDRPTHTILGVDVAHLVAFVTKWKCFDRTKRTPVKNLYVRAITLMIDAESVEDFGYILLLTCCIAQAEYEDIPTGIPLIPTPKDARNRLEELIANRCRDIPDEEVANASLAQEEGRQDYPTEPDNSQNCTLTVTHQWVRRIIENARPDTSTDQEELSPAKEVNPFWCPDFIPHLESIAKEFPLWTAATVPCNMGHFSSSYMEAYFKELKAWLRGQYGQRGRVDRFLRIHILDDLIGGNKLLATELKRNARIRELLNANSTDCHDTATAPAGLSNPHGPLNDHAPSGLSKPRDPLNNAAPAGLSNPRRPLNDSAPAGHSNPHRSLNDTPTAGLSNPHRPLNDTPTASLGLSGPSRPRDDSTRAANRNVGDTGLSHGRVPTGVHATSTYLKPCNPPVTSASSCSFSCSANSRSGAPCYNVSSENSNSYRQHNVENSVNPGSKIDATNSSSSVPHFEVSRSPVLSGPKIHEKTGRRNERIFIASHKVKIRNSKMLGSDVSDEDFTSDANSDTGNIKLFSNPTADLSLAGVRRPDGPQLKARGLDDSDLYSIEQWRGLINQDPYYFAASTMNEDLFFEDGEIVHDSIESIPSRSQRNNEVHVQTGQKSKKGHAEVPQDVKNSSQVFMKPSVSATEQPRQQRSSSADNQENTIRDKKSVLIHSDNGKQKVPSWYFSKCPAIKTINSLGVNTRGKKDKHFIVPNGRQCGVVVIDGRKIGIDNTCPFDALTQTLIVAADDDPYYRAHIEGMDQPIFKFIKNFGIVGPTKSILADRAKILKQFYPVNSPKPSALSGFQSDHLDAHDALSRAWSKIFHSDPSAVEMFQCSSTACIPVMRQISILDVNYNKIASGGFSALRSALKFHSNIYNVKCKNERCGGEGTISCSTNAQIFISLDVRTSQQRSKGLRGELKDFPVILQLEVPYRLIGVIGYESELNATHFIAYCRRGSGRWTGYDGLKSTVLPCEESLEIEPHGALYIISHQK